MGRRLARALPIWRRTVSLSWPIAIQQVLNTLMRTVDLLVTGLFSPAAVAAIGLADLYSRFPRQVGSALGAGAIAIASQDTGRDATETRDRAVTQAMLLALLVGIPFVAVGLLAADALIAVLGASEEVVRLGGTYLMIVFAVGPMRLVGYVGAKALQGTGDTRTPMFVNGASNATNIVGTVGLGLGLGGLPELGIVGVGLATAGSRTLEAVAMVVAIASDRTPPNYALPRDLTITRQIVAIGIPRLAEQMSRAFASFPFNALLLLFGTEANAAYHIGKRIYQQFVAPIYRSSSTAAAIIVGQRLGDGDADGARFAAFAIVALGVGLLLPAGALLFLGATPLSSVFTNDPGTVGFATWFTRTYAVAMVFFGVLFPFVGALRGAGDTRTPFYAQFTSQLGVLLGASYLLAIVLEFGVVGFYFGIVLATVWRTLVVSVGFLRGRWAENAATMIADRAEAGTD